LLEDSLRLLRKGDHPLFLFFALEQLAYVSLLSGEFDQAGALQDEALAVGEQIDDPWVKAHVLFHRALQHVDRAPETAYARFHEGLPHIRAVGDRNMLSMNLNYLGALALALGNVDEAEHTFAEALAWSAEFENGIEQISALNGLANVACARASWAEAITQCDDALNISRKVGDRWNRAKVLVTLGEAEAGLGNRTAAHHHFTEAITESLAAHVLPTAIEAWLRLVTLDTENNHGTAALLTILALVRRHPATSRPSAGRAAALWNTLTAQVSEQMRATAEHTAGVIAPEQLSLLLSAYAEGRAALPTWQT
jgi:tetratricopeptide (TPR) repeat protein